MKNENSSIELFRFLGEKYKNDLLIDGKLRIPSFHSLSKNEDLYRKDKDEGVFTIIKKSNHETVEMKVGIELNNCFVLCLSTSKSAYRKKGDCCLKIKDIKALLNQIEKGLNDKGYNVKLIVGNKCIYNNKTIVENISDNQRIEKIQNIEDIFFEIGKWDIIPAFLKDESKIKEDEFRIVFITNKTVSDYIFIELDNANKYFEQI